jgi:hypothetical protein
MIRAPAGRPLDLLAEHPKAQKPPDNLLALQKRHAQAHEVIEGIPMHHVFATIHDVEVDLWLLFF